jgi:hypothetical protein
VQSVDHLERSIRVGAVERDVLPRADLPAEIADRAAEEACAEIEPEHERGLRHGFEEGGSVRRAARARLRLTHEPGVEQRAQRQRDGRLRDPGTARDLRPRDRRAGPDRVQDGALVHVLQQRRRRA